MNRRNFLKVIGAGATTYTIAPLGKRIIDGLVLAPTPTPIVPPGKQLATPGTGDVLAPSGGLGSNSNYFLASDCSPVTGLSVTIDVTQDILSDIGFSFQLNCYSPQGANSFWQQYIMEFDTANGTPLKIFAMVDNWPSDSHRQALNEPAGSDLINTGGQPMLTLPTAALPVGYKIMITLEYDKEYNVNGAKFTVIDTKGKSTVKEIVLESLNANHTNPPKRITTADLAPIYAFELNLVGRTNSQNTYLLTGAGTFTYAATSSLTVLSKKPVCVAGQGIDTAETANSVYGALPAGPSKSISQSFATLMLNPYSVGGPFAVAQQVGADQTDLFVVNSMGQLVVFYVQNNTHWSVSKPKGPAGMTIPGAAVAVTPHFGVPNRTDVFVVDQERQLNLFWVDGLGEWNGPQPIGTKPMTRAGAHLAASQHFGTTNQTDVFVIDKDGQLTTFWATGAGDWQGPKVISAAGLAHPGAPLAVSQQFGADQTDIFVVDSNGQLNVFSANGAGKWTGPLLLGPKDFAPSGADLAVSQHFGVFEQTDVLLVDNHGQVNVFSITGTSQWTEPQPIGPKDLAKPGAALSVSQHFGVSDQTDVFLIDKQGQLNVFSATGSGHWTVPFTVGQPGFAPSGAFVIASPQFGMQNRTDLFVISQAGSSSHSWPNVFWAGSTGGWSGPKELVNEI